MIGLISVITRPTGWESHRRSVFGAPGARDETRAALPADVGPLHQSIFTSGVATCDNGAVTRMSKTHQGAGPRNLAGNTPLPFITIRDARPAPTMVSPSQVIRNEPMLVVPSSGRRGTCQSPGGRHSNLFAEAQPASIHCSRCRPPSRPPLGHRLT